MKLIDLLVKIANKEELPKKIKFEDDVYVLSEYKHIYMTEDKMCCLLGTINFNGSNLNTDVEIVTDIKTIEDETDYFEIEKIDVELLNQCDNWLNDTSKNEAIKGIELNKYIIETIRKNTLDFQHKINEIIDYLSNNHQIKK